MPSKSNFKLSQGLELITIYNLVASGPYFLITSNGSTAFPSLFDILFPSLSNTRPLDITFSKLTFPNNIIEIA